MSLFDYLIISTLGPFAILYAFRFGKSIYQFPRAKKWRACTICPPPDDALKSAKEVRNFLLDRCKEVNLNEWEICIYDMLENGDSFQLIRLCHALGCELVIRKVVTKILK